LELTAAVCVWDACSEFLLLWNKKCKKRVFIWSQSLASDRTFWAAFTIGEFRGYRLK
jgi:hypothetical protein